MVIRWLQKEILIDFLIFSALLSRKNGLHAHYSAHGLWVISGPCSGGVGGLWLWPAGHVQV